MAMKKKATKKKADIRKTVGEAVVRRMKKNSRNVTAEVKKIIGKTPAPFKNANVAPKVKENSLWNWFRSGCIEALKDYRGEDRLSKLHMVRIENTGETFVDVEGVYTGIPFVAELKTLARPIVADKRKTPTLSLPHYTNAQAMFLVARWNAGERSWLFVQVAETRYLVPGKHALLFLQPFKETLLQKYGEDTAFGDTALDFLLAMVGK